VGALKQRDCFGAFFIYKIDKNAASAEWSCGYRKAII
jgi:hypothetical protein